MLKSVPIGGAAILIAGLCVALGAGNDRLFWPSSAHNRIEKMASVLRFIEGPAKWCYASTHSLNLVNQNGYPKDLLGRCIQRIEPASNFEEIHKKHYIRRIFRAEVERDLFCEVTLSTVWNDERIVDSDCYYGLFKQSDDTGIGLTADPFG